MNQRSQQCSATLASSLRSPQKCQRQTWSRATYKVENYQISGAPKWFNTQTSTTSKQNKILHARRRNPKARPAKKPASPPATDADRFSPIASISLRTAKPRTCPSTSLLIGKSGSKLQEPKPGEAYEHGIKSSEGEPYKDAIFFSGRAGSLTITAQAASMTSLAGVLSGRLNRPVIDKTGLTGFYDFSFPFAPEEVQSASVPSGAVPAPGAPESNLPTLSVAIEEHLGLKLESGKGPAPIIVIDRIEKPSGN